MSIEIGQTIEANGYRAHRFTDSIQVTDLANAGKRGQVCRKFTLRAWNSWNAYLDTICGRVGDISFEGLYYQSVFAATQLSGLDMSEYELPAMDVAPAGFENIEINGLHVSVTAEFDTFCVRDLDDKCNEPTLIPGERARKRSVKAFYRWVSENRDAIATMRFGVLTDAIRAAGVDAHYFCAVD